MDVRQYLVYAEACPSRQVRPILKVKRAPKRAYPSFRRFSCAIANHFLGDPDSDVKNAKFFLWMSVKTLSMHLIGPHGPSTHLKGQTSPEASIPLISTIFMCYSKPIFGWFGFRHKKCQSFLWTCVKTLDMHPVGPHGQSDQFSRSNEPRSEHTPISTIFLCYSKSFFGWSGLRRRKFQKKL